MESESERRARAQRLEREYAASPQAYRWRLGAWALLGYGAFGAALVSSVGLTLFLISALFWRPWQDTRILIPILLFGISAVLLLRLARLQVADPAGYRLPPGEAPALQEEVERIRAALGARPLDGIVLDDRLNACAAFIPRGFGLRPPRHYLVLGLPLLQLLDRREAAAVIAHEFGHFHHRDGRFPAWIYGLRARLETALSGMGESLAQHNTLLLLFFRWFYRHFDARSQIVARQQEFVADRVAAELVGAEPLVRGLARLELAELQLQRQFWPEVERSAVAQAYPPALVHARLGEALRHERAQASTLPAWLLHERNDPDDTHPRLAARMQAAGIDASLALVSETESAADHWLGAELCARLQDGFTQRWQDAQRPHWDQQHRQHLAGRQRLEALEALPAKSAADWLEQAELSELHRPGADVAGLYQQGLDAWPGHAAGHYRRGLWLLGHGDAGAGAEALQRAAQLDASVLETVVERLEQFSGRDDDGRVARCTESARERLLARHAGDAGAAGEAPYAGHSWDEAQLRALLQLLRAQPKIQAAWLLRDTRAGASALPHHVLLVDWRGSIASENATLPQLARQLHVPGTLAVRSTSERSAELASLRAHAGEPIHQRR